MTVTIVDYDPGWSRAFALEYDRWLPVIGPWTLGLEHMGSTAVPGLAGKPVIDLLVGVRSLSDADRYCMPALQAHGYCYVPAAEAFFPQRRFFTRDAADGTRTHHIHLAQRGSAFWRDHVLFRDYLRAHPAVAADYAAHKRALAPLHASSEAYAEAKAGFIVPRVQAARLWQATTAHCLRTTRVQLRPWTADDLPAFAALNAHPKVMEFLLKALSYDESAKLLARLQEHFAQHGFGLWAVQLWRSGSVVPVGWVGLSVPAFDAPFTPCVEVSWRLHSDHWGQGIATEAARAALDFGFEQLRLLEVVSFTVPANLRSRRVMEKLGMRRASAEDFDHPAVPAEHPLLRHVLYRLRRADVATIAM